MEVSTEKSCAQRLNGYDKQNLLATYLKKSIAKGTWCRLSDSGNEEKI